MLVATILRERRYPSGAVLRVVRGNLVREPVDAIVNAANEWLQHGGGVAGAIAAAGGPAIQRESDAIGHVATGSCAVTSGGELSCRYVIHAVGPVYRGTGDEDDLLAAGVRSSLEAADRLGLSSISIPGISSGIYGFPKDRCAAIIVREAESFLQREPAPSVTEVRLCNIDEKTAVAFVSAFDQTGA
jgi:O-acetyl-ADP-ribose deacetylase (regulator of RNase III)